jgi:hypothetical protein
MRRNEKEYRDREFEVRSQQDALIVTVPGENPLELELLKTKLAEAVSATSVLQREYSDTIAKCLWLKQRRQLFLMAKLRNATCDPNSPAYDEVAVLNATVLMLEGETDEQEINVALRALALHQQHLLLKHCPRRKFKTTKAWARGLQSSIAKVLLPAATRFGEPPDEALIAQSAAVLDDEAFRREIEMDERLNAMRDRAIEQLFRIKQLEQRITFDDMRRFDRMHPERMTAILKAKP